MGWEENDSFKLQDAVDICTSTSGTVQDCPVFTLQDQPTMNECKIDLPGELLKEAVEGPISSLPGDVQVFWGPGPASVDSSEATAPSSIVLPTLTYSAGSTASVNGSFVPGNAFKAASTPKPESVPMADAVKGAAVVTPAPEPTGTADEIVTSTAYETTTLADGTVMVNEVIYEEVIDYVTVATTTTVYVDPTAAPAARRRSAHAHHNRHVHGRVH